MSNACPIHLCAMIINYSNSMYFVYIMWHQNKDSGTLNTIIYNVLNDDER